jgi:hypothetical protein
MILKIRPDDQKSRALVDMARVTLLRLNETNIYKYPANTLTDYYDIIHKLMESLTISKGIKFSGDGSHKELIDYVCKVYGFNESDRIFLQEMRDFRNRTSYEGFMINENYIRINLKRINHIIKKLGDLLKIKII